MKRKQLAMSWLTVAASIVLASCGGSSTNTTLSPEPGGSSLVTIDGFAFSPATITVQAGTEVTWRNLQGSPHTVTGDAAEFDSAQLVEDAEFSQIFDTPGDFAYHCEIHPNMTGVVIVEP